MVKEIQSMKTRTKRLKYEIIREQGKVAKNHIMINQLDNQVRAMKDENRKAINEIDKMHEELEQLLEVLEEIKPLKGQVSLI